MRPAVLNRIITASELVYYNFGTYLKSHTAYQIWNYEQHSVYARNSWRFRDGLTVSDPFADRQLFEFAWRMDPKLKFKDGVGKFILRQMASEFLPDYITQAKLKTGFAVPFSSWLSAGPLCDLFHDYIGLLPQSELSEYVDSGKLLGALPEQANPMFIWQLMNALIWENKVKRL